MQYIGECLAQSKYSIMWVFVIKLYQEEDRSLEVKGKEE